MTRAPSDQRHFQDAVAKACASVQVIPRPLSLPSVAVTYHAKASLDDGRVGGNRRAGTVRVVLLLVQDLQGMPGADVLAGHPRNRAEDVILACGSRAMAATSFSASLSPLSSFAGAFAYGRTTFRPSPALPADGLDDAGRADLRVLLAQDVGTRLRDAIGVSGFSDVFLDALGICDAVVVGRSREMLAELFARGREGTRLRDFVRTNRVVAAWACSDDTDVTRFRKRMVVDSVTSGLSPARQVFPGAAEPELVMRRLEGAAATAFGMRPGPALALAAAVPLDWLPATDAARSRFATVAAYAVPVSRSLGLPLAGLVRSCRGDWEAFDARCRGVGPAADGVHDVERTARLAKDVVDDLAAKVVLPVLARAYTEQGDGPWDVGAASERATRVAGDVLLGGKSLPAILDLSSTWHRAHHAVHGALPSGRMSEPVWPALFEGTFRFGDLEIRALTSATELRHEGMPGTDPDGFHGLDHCVATYVPYCYLSNGNILSVATTDSHPGRRVSTVQCEVSKEGRLTVVQHLGRGNLPPPDKAVEAVQALCRQTFTARRPVVPPTPFDEVATRCGFDWTDDDLFARSLATYAPLMPRGLRKMDEAALREAFGTRPPPAVALPG